MQAITNALKQVFDWIHVLVPSYGLDIILFTLLLKLVLLPLNIRQTKSMVKTQMIQPKLNEIQKKYKNDPQKLQQAQLDLYKNEGVNPMSGCLPLLIQMPILFSIFYVFRDYQFQGQGFLWIPNLNGPDPYYILPVISGLSTYVSTLLSTPKGQDNAKNPGSSKTMNLVMSGFFLYVSLTMHAGLVLYWVVNNVLQMAMQYALNKAMHKEVETAAIK